MIDGIKAIMNEIFMIDDRQYNKFESFVSYGRVHTRINIKYENCSAPTVELIERNFVVRMEQLGYKLMEIGSSSIPNGIYKTVVLKHHMIFSIPINKRITRPSMKILLGLS